MKNNAIEYPHPVLNEYTSDFIGCDFSIEIVSHGDNGNNIELEIKYLLNCPGIDNLLHNGLAKIIVKLTCYRTSYRTAIDINVDETTLVSIPKSQITDTLELQASIVSTKDNDSYFLPEFNEEYFGTKQFHLRKGDVIANEPGIRIKLNTMLEKNTSGVVLVTGSPSISEMEVHYASIDETDPSLSNYIVVVLPDIDYKNYAKLMTKKHMKIGVERFLQASVILPAITEGISRIRTEETQEPDEDDPIYAGTVWADSIKNALHNIGVDDLNSCTKSDYELANRILGNVCSDSLNNLMQKITDWSTIRQEDEVL